MTAYFVATRPFSRVIHFYKRKDPITGDSFVVYDHTLLGNSYYALSIMDNNLFASRHYREKKDEARRDYLPSNGHSV